MMDCNRNCNQGRTCMCDKDGEWEAMPDGEWLYPLAKFIAALALVSAVAVVLFG